MKPVYNICILLLLTAYTSTAQVKAPRVLEAKRTTGKVKIDGLLTDPAWKDAAVMTDMVYFKPKTGAPED